MVWANTIPLESCGAAEFRVLLQLANVHHDKTGAAWQYVVDMSRALSCSQRTVQRALKSLESAGLIRPGDQRFVLHIRKDRRPTVYELAIGGLWPRRPAPVDQTPLDGMTPDVTPSPVDNFARGDRHAADGVTPAVALGTVEPTMAQKRTQAQTARGRVVDTAALASMSSEERLSHDLEFDRDRLYRRRCRDGSQFHRYIDAQSDWCEICGIHRYKDERKNWNTGLRKPI